ncbi:TetR/AcrR family transcriptional regulator [Microbispora corallina]|nr:TetR/AcrR family transcriptional regulator [Microbispora corallina]
MGGVGEGGPESDTARQRVIEKATHLFASLGYDGTPVQMIADAAGLDIDTVTDLVGGKRELYLTVMRRHYLATQAMFNTAFTEFTPDRAGVLLVVDRFLDFYTDHPEVPELWIHRWLSDAADITGLEGLYLKPLRDSVKQAFRRAAGPGADVDMTLETIIWCVRGFVVGGMVSASGEVHGPANVEYLRRFRTYLHQLVTRSLALNE